LQPCVAQDRGAEALEQIWLLLVHAVLASPINS
jgi:hypothetical protein